MTLGHLITFGQRGFNYAGELLNKFRKLANLLFVVLNLSNFLHNLSINLLYIILTLIFDSNNFVLLT